MVAREQATIFEQTQERMRGSIVPAVAAKLQFLRDPNVARFTSASLEAPDFGMLRRRPQAIYWCLEEHDMGRLRPLTSLFFTLVFEQIARAAPPDCPDAVPVRALLDEFANIGTLPQFDTTVSLSRSRGLSLWLGLQSLSQLEDRYGKASAQTILANCANKIVLSGLDIDSAEYVSRTLGQTTVVTERRSWSLRHLFGKTSSVSYGQTEIARPLLTPDEVRRIGSREILVVSTNRAPILLRRFIYTLAPQAGMVSSLGPAQCGEQVRSITTNKPKTAELPPNLPNDLLEKVPQEKDSVIPPVFRVPRLPRHSVRVKHQTVKEDSK